MKWLISQHLSKALHVHIIKLKWLGFDVQRSNQSSSEYGWSDCISASCGNRLIQMKLFYIKCPHDRKALLPC